MVSPPPPQTTTTTTTTTMTVTVTQESPSRASQPQSQLRRISSITQRFRGHSRSTSTTAVTESSSSWPAHDDKDDQARRPSSCYVPTHAAASFARTVSPLSPVRIEAKIEEDDLEQLSSSSGKKAKHRSHRQNHHHHHHTTITTATTTSATPTTSEHKTQSVPNTSSHPATAGASLPSSSKKAPRHGCAPSRQQQQQQQQQQQHEQKHDHKVQHEHQTEYAAFLAQAEARERARLALRRQKCVSMPSRAPSTSLHASKTTTAATVAAVAIMRGSPSPMATTKATPAVRSHAHRDSAYYSNASRSSASGSGGGGGGRAGGVAGAAAMDQNLLGRAGRLLAVRQPKTLGRRLSEYFKPPRREVCV
ncbi:hypothetical protein E4U59_006698 [Claviceps monticola]|nr:hypothetical protein E4U59_006698 [Claviceps monticola]